MPNKIGKLVGVNQRRSVAGRLARRAIMLLVSIVLLAGVVLMSGGWAKANLQPRKLVIINTNMVTAEELLEATGISGEDSYASLQEKARTYDESSARWLKSVDSWPTWGWAMVLDPTERLPALRVVAGGAKYWLCDDGTLAKMDVDNDHGGVFDRIRTMPSVELLADPGTGPLAGAEFFLATGAYCQAQLPGLIALIRVTPDGEFNLIDERGMEIRLGQQVELKEKMSNLLKLLRVCEVDRNELDYLEASDPDKPVENWTVPPG